MFLILTELPLSGSGRAAPITPRAKEDHPCCVF